MSLTRRHVLIAIAFLFLVSSIFFTATIDQRVMLYFYQGNQQWWAEDFTLLNLFYYPINAILFSTFLLVSSVVLLASLSQRAFFEPFRLYKRHALFFMSLTLIGAGLFNGFLLKQLFARPRPTLFIEEGIYVAAFRITPEYFGQSNLSFPSGHVSMSVLLFACFFVFEKPCWLKKGIGLLASSIVIALMSLQRIASGAHYPTDALFAILFMLVFTAILYKGFRLDAANRVIMSQTIKFSKPSLVDAMLMGLAALGPTLFIAVILMISNGLRAF